MQIFKILLKHLFCSTAKRSLLNVIPVLYPESFVLCKKAVYNHLHLDLYPPLNF